MRDDRGVVGSANTRFALAVHALVLMRSQPDRPWTSEELAGSAGASPVHVRRVLGRLREAGWVRSRPGARGGWTLAADACRLGLDDIWRAIHGDDTVLGLQSADPRCAHGQRIQGEMERIERTVAEAVEERLAGVSLADLVAATAPQRLR